MSFPANTIGQLQKRLVDMRTNSALGRGTIYTLGYSKPGAATLLERLMHNPRACLLDVRYRPVSRWNPQWNYAALTARYGERYVWERRLGNVNYRSHGLPIQLAVGSQETVREAAALVCAGTSLVLLCACADERACHRLYVATLMQDALPLLVSPWEGWA
jgi:Domain of unknown function DUF488